MEESLVEKTGFPLLPGKKPRLPHSVVLFVVVVCLLPVILNALGLYFGSEMIPKNSSAHLVFYSLSGSFLHTILEWSAFCVAIFIVVLAMINYKLRHDMVTVVIALALFFAGCTDAFHTLVSDRLIHATADNRTLIPFVWALSRTFNAVILIFGVFFIMLFNRRLKRRQYSLTVLMGVALFMGVAAYLLIYISAEISVLPRMMFPASIITRPWDVAPLVLYFWGGLIIFPYFYYKYPSVFAYALMVSMVAQIAAQMYMVFGSSELFDNYFNIAHFLKIVAYVVPLLGLLMDYINTYETAQYQAKALEISRDEALVAVKAKAAFLATMSHEIRTPLNGVIGMTSLLAQSALTKEQTIHLKAIQVSGSDLLHIINDILDYSKIEAGRLTLEAIDFEVRELIKEMHELTINKAQNKKIELNYSVQAEVPDYLTGDPARLRQVLSNLLSNAIKFTEKGRVKLLVSLKEREVNKVTLLFEVQDTGVGISKAAQATLFGAFTQEDSSTTRKFGGTGLGLAISKDLVRLFHGEIGVDSVKGKGSTFWFTAMFTKAETVGKTHPAEKKAIKVVPGEQKILVVEDNLVNQQVIVALLKKLGYQTALANDGREAVEALKRSSYDLVLMDCQMPVMDGYEATRVIRHMQDAKKDVTIIALTANAMEGDKERCLEVGMDDYLSKEPSRNNILF